AHLVGEGRQAAAQVRKFVGQSASRAAFADVRVPTAYVDEAELHAVTHQVRDAPGLHREALAADGIATGAFHLVGHLATDLAAHLEASADRRSQARVGVRATDDLGLPLVNR